MKRTRRSDWLAGLRKALAQLVLEGDAVPPKHELPLIVRAPDKPRHIVYATKEALVFRHMFQRRALSPDTAVFVRGAVATTEYAAVVREYAQRHRLGVRFVGDLHPRDIAIYLSLLAGGDTAKGKRSSVPVSYAGIDDGWLRLAATAFGPPRNPLARTPGGKGGLLATMALPMKTGARNLLVLIEEIVPDLGALLGPQCANILREGRYLATDALLADGHFEEAYFHRALVRLVRSPPRQTHPPLRA